MSKNSDCRLVYGFESEEAFFEEITDLEYKKRKRIVKYFEKEKCQYLMSLLKNEGYTNKELSNTMFARRFGYLFVIFNFIFLEKSINLNLKHVININVKGLNMVGSSYNHTEKGIRFFKLFEISYCDNDKTRLCFGRIK